MNKIIKAIAAHEESLRVAALWLAGVIVLLTFAISII
jgi:hypothetical protein